MEDAEILRLVGRARALAIKWGYPQHADDFAQEAFIAIANGSHPKLEWLFVDFLRKSHGSSRTISGRIRQRAEKFALRLDAPVGEDEGSALGHDIVGSADSSAGPERDVGRAPIPYERLFGREKDFAWLSLEKEWTNERIAQAYNTSASRVCQVLASAKAKLKPWIEYETLYEEHYLDDHFMEIKLR